MYYLGLILHAHHAVNTSSRQGIVISHLYRKHKMNSSAKHHIKYFKNFRKFGKRQNLKPTLFSNADCHQSHLTRYYISSYIGYSTMCKFKSDSLKTMDFLFKS